jgi:hypothetical protein
MSLISSGRIWLGIKGTNRSLIVHEDHCPAVGVVENFDRRNNTVAPRRATFRIDKRACDGDAELEAIACRQILKMVRIQIQKSRSAWFKIECATNDRAIAAAQATSLSVEKCEHHATDLRL